MGLQLTHLFRLACWGLAALLAALWLLGVVPLWVPVVVGLLPWIIGGLAALVVLLIVGLLALWVKLSK